MKEYLENESHENLTEQEKEQFMPQTTSQAGKTGVRLFYILPLLYVITVYLLPFLLLLSEGSRSSIKYLFCLLLALGVANIIVAIKLCKPGNRFLMLNAAILVKYALIPFFLVGGLVELATILFAFMPVPPFIFIFGSMATIGAAGGWLILVLGGAPYVISYLRLASKEGIVPKFVAKILFVLQFFFTVDVIAVMLLALKEHRWIKLTFIIIGLFVAIVFLFIVLVILGMVGIIMA